MKRKEPSIEDILEYIRGAWSGAHAQYDMASSYSSQREYDGRIAALQQVSRFIGVDLEEQAPQAGATLPKGGPTIENPQPQGAAPAL